MKLTRHLLHLLHLLHDALQDRKQEPMYIIAGSYQQYVDYCHGLGIDPKVNVYVRDPLMLLGLTMSQVDRIRFVGTWQQLPNADKFVEYAKQAVKYT